MAKPCENGQKWCVISIRMIILQEISLVYSFYFYICVDKYYEQKYPWVLKSWKKNVETFVIGTPDWIFFSLLKFSVFIPRTLCTSWSKLKSNAVLNKNLWSTPSSSSQTITISRPLMGRVTRCTLNQRVKYVFISVYTGYTARLQQYMRRVWNFQPGGAH